ncbi:caspase, EACC1-associated type [Rhodoflexus caldus]|uniref:caspase, EACC1-associated type n=1 Tax=Rhodoflexus caldus TaxID=2891236 RepID=UPI00202A0239|nr:leucine-rich repeat domain-containing protein [Rhodoflexus caldus]
MDYSKFKVLLIGASEFVADKSISPIPNVEVNINKLKEYLLDKSIAGIPRENVLVLLNESKTKIETTLVDLAKEAKTLNHTLLVYYSGHGILSDKNFNLYLTTSETTKQHLEYTGINIDTFKEIIKGSKAGQKLVILDCCHSGKIIGNMGSLESQLRSELHKFEGTYIVTSADEFTPATFDPTNPNIPTNFTGYLIEILKNGLDNSRPYLSVGEIFENLKYEFEQRGNLPIPQMAGIEEGHKILLTKNPFYFKNEKGENILITVGISEQEKDFFVDETLIYFSEYDEQYNYESDKNALLEATNFDISLKATYCGELAGFYLLGNYSSLFKNDMVGKDKIHIEYKIDIGEYRHKKALEGIALLVFKKFLGLGIGKKLINASVEYAQNEGYDYIFGGQLQTLNNLTHWLKAGRILVAKSSYTNITVFDLNTDVQRKIRFAKDNKDKFLNLSNAKLTHLPINLFELEHLEHLILSFNELTEIPHSITKLRNLKRLVLTGNKLESIPKYLQELPNLVYLSLAKNNIRKFTYEFKCPKLQELTLSENQLTELPDFLEFPALEVLELRHNYLSNLPSAILNFQNLTYLGLQDNKLTTIPKNLASLKNLRKLQLEGNPIDSRVFGKSLNEVLGILHEE